MPANLDALSACACELQGLFPEYVHTCVHTCVCVIGWFLQGQVVHTLRFLCQGSHQVLDTPLGIHGPRGTGLGHRPRSRSLESRHNHAS